MTEANSINAATTGIVGNTGTAFTGTAVTQYNVLIGGSTSSTLSNVAPSATSGIPLISAGSSANPSFGTAVVAGGGTGQVTLTNHGVLIGAGTSAITQLAAGTAGQVLQSGGGSADPAYSTATYPATAGTSGNVLTSNGTNWTSAAPATSGTVTSVSGTANQVAVANGTTTPVISLIGPYTPATYTTHGVLIGEGTSSITALGAGSSGQVLQSGGASADPAYSTATYPATTTVSQILYSSSANVVAGLATGNNGVLITSASGVPSLLANGTTGQVLTATTGSPPTWAAVSGGSGSIVGWAHTNSNTAVSTSVALGATTTPTTANTSILISLTYTPTSSSNYLNFQFSCPCGVNTAAPNGGGFFIFAGSTLLASYPIPGVGNSSATTASIHYTTLANTTSSTTYAIYFAAFTGSMQSLQQAGSATALYGGGTNVSTNFVIFEIKA